MENTRKKQVGSSSSSFTMDLFGPKDSSTSSSSAGLFGSVFGPPSTGLGKDSSQSGIMGSSRKQGSATQYDNIKNGSPDYFTKRNKGESGGIPNKDRSSIYQHEAADPCYLSSSIYYGGQEIYPPNGQTTGSQHINDHFKKDDGEDDPSGSNSSSASRGNWWQGSLYY